MVVMPAVPPLLTQHQCPILSGPHVVSGISGVGTTLTGVHHLFVRPPNEDPFSYLSTKTVFVCPSDSSSEPAFHAWVVLLHMLANKRGITLFCSFSVFAAHVFLCSGVQVP